MRDVFDDDFLRKIDVFREAVDKNSATPFLKPLSGQVHVQVMPKPARVGLIHTLGKEDKIGTKSNGFGTVINVGPDVVHVSAGDDVIFPRKFGRKFGGMYNPLQTGKDTDWFDELRVLNTMNVIGTIHYEYTGRTVRFKVAGGDDLEGVVEEESVLYGGLLKVVTEGDPEPYWVPYRNLIE